MPNIDIVTPEKFAGKRWKKFSSYEFAARDSVCPIVMHELPKAIMNLPTCFILQNGQYVLVALQGLEPSKNNLVADDGRWLAGYVPALYRSYPFLLASGSDDQKVFCINLDSGLVTNAVEEQPFFDEHNRPSQTISEIFNFLTLIAQNQESTRIACSLLQKLDLLEAWPIEQETKNGKKKIEGLYRVNETKLNSLSANVLAELQATGTLLLVYCQLLSMQHLDGLAALIARNLKGDTSRRYLAPAELDLDFLNNSGSIDFGNF